MNKKLLLVMTFAVLLLSIFSVSALVNVTDTTGIEMTGKQKWQMFWSFGDANKILKQFEFSNQYLRQAQLEYDKGNEAQSDRLMQHFYYHIGEAGDKIDNVNVERLSEKKMNQIVNQAETQAAEALSFAYKRALGDINKILNGEDSSNPIYLN